jgi:hypothetical protein
MPLVDAVEVTLSPLVWSGLGELGKTHLTYVLMNCE